MVAKVISGKDIQGALNYNEQKVKSGTAECISANKIPCDVQHLSFHDKLNLFLHYTSKNHSVKTNTLHISLNFDPSERLSKDKLSTIATSYMEKIGFDDQPYLVYEHQDAAHPHVHIITTNIKDDGKRIDIHNIGKDRSEKARKEIEKEFGLVKAESKQKNQIEFLRPVDVQKAVYGKSETKRTISNIVWMVIRKYKYTSLPEFNAILKQYNMVADRGAKGSLMYEKKGLNYSLLDDKGNKVGVPIKASTIYRKPTLSFLEGQFKLHEILRKPDKGQLMESIDVAVVSHPKNLNGFLKTLDKQGVKVVIRDNEKGTIYGITYVDNRTRSVFNGSDLGKAYSAKGILERLDINVPSRNKPIGLRQGYSETLKNESKDNFIDYELEAIRTMKEFLEAKPSEYISPEAAMQLNRKKQRRKGRSI